MFLSVEDSVADWIGLDWIQLKNTSVSRFSTLQAAG
jgi:hypothetical protein